MKIHNFKFRETTLNDIYVPNILKIANVFGVPYLIKYIIFILENITSDDKKQKQTILDQLNTLCVNRQINYWKNSIISIELEKIVKPIKGTTTHFYLINLLENFLLEINDSKYLFNDRFHFGTAYSVSNNIILKDLYLFDFKKIEIMFYKKFDYIYVKDKSFWGTNWYSYETHTRGKDKIKYVIPFYRNISREVINFHLALELNFFDTNVNQKIKYNPAAYYMPLKEWDPIIKDIVTNIRQRLQRNKPFKVEYNYQVINDNYYVYNNKLIDINFNLYKLNTKWLKEAKIIKASIKK